MAKYNVILHLQDCLVPDIEADTEEEAIEQAYDMYFDFNPKDHWAYKETVILVEE